MAPGPVKGECGCGCGDFGALRKRPGRDGTVHTKRCGCGSCQGRRNRDMGDRKARQARRRLGLGGANTRHEEHWRGRLRVESKAGEQVGPIATRFQAAEAQSAAQRAIGDDRPFAFVAMPAGWGSDGIVLVRLSEWERSIGPLLEAGPPGPDGGSEAV